MIITCGHLRKHIQILQTKPFTGLVLKESSFEHFSTYNSPSTPPDINNTQFALGHREKFIKNTNQQ